MGEAGKPFGLDFMREKNDAHTARLAAEHVQVAGLELVYLTVLVEALLGDNLPETQLVFEARRAKVLDEVDIAARRARLHVPGSN